jgi:hypothetical protein
MQIHRHNLKPVLAWVREHEELQGSSGEPSPFEFSIHKLAFLQALKLQGQEAALEYARTHFPAFRRSQMQQIQRLMGALCFSQRAGNGSSSKLYAHLFNEDLWGNAAREFVRQSCTLLGQVWTLNLSALLLAPKVTVELLVMPACMCHSDGAGPSCALFAWTCVNAHISVVD